ncbi:hypothetical protein Ga0100231_013590 [Opitutaceae bacterium TAV4]|nr:hypothetical protein Ga0100231_013590 [Opitutaceae bacterium TAV4]RRK01116.1 hypothetical protein Ga0100230_014940 [Opitutaceae bacterium TAV3]
MKSALQRLSEWYASQCDGDWEHSYGFKISTLDNPGVAIEIDLFGTRHSRRCRLKRRKTITNLPAIGWCAVGPRIISSEEARQEGWRTSFSHFSRGRSATPKKANQPRERLWLIYDVRAFSVYFVSRGGAENAEGGKCNIFNLLIPSDMSFLCVSVSLRDLLNLATN